VPKYDSTSLRKKQVLFSFFLKYFTILDRCSCFS